MPILCKHFPIYAAPEKVFHGPTVHYNLHQKLVAHTVTDASALLQGMHFLINLLHLTPADLFFRLAYEMPLLSKFPL